jgi:ABC-type Fe3+/spermidine/putrescine transport system ATPase subunit
VIEIAGLEVALSGFALRGINLHIEPGEYFIVLGPNGAGKTVLLESIAGLHPVSKGTILLGGRDISHLEPEKRGIGIVYQDQCLFPHLSVRENIAFGLKSLKCPKHDVEARTERIAGLVGVDHLMRRGPSTLSGGERQKVALARALAPEPRLLLLDEPLTALDPATKERMQRELAEIHRRLDVTVIHVTHDLEEAMVLADRVAVLNQGRIVQIGTPEEVMRRPNSEFVASFAQSRNLFAGHIADVAGADAVAVVGGMRLRATTTLRGRVHLSIRPEDIFISGEPLRSTAGDSFQGTVTEIVDRGQVIHVAVSIPPEFICLVSRQSFGELDLRVGRPVWITIKTSAIHVF